MVAIIQVMSEWQLPTRKGHDHAIRMRTISDGEDQVSELRCTGIQSHDPEVPPGEQLAQVPHPAHARDRDSNAGREDRAAEQREPADDVSQYHHDHRGHQGYRHLRKLLSRENFRVMRLDASQYTDAAEPADRDYTNVVELDRSEYTEVR
jgi:hypothetical protein